MALSVLSYILIFSFIGSVAGLAGGLLLLWKEKYAKGISLFLVSFAVGVLLAATFFDLLPEAVELGAESIWLWVIAGFFLFVILEKAFIWHHSHEIMPHKHRHKHPSRKSYVWLLVAGDTLHNAIDGVIIAATFLIDISLGIITTLAVFLHELPAEIGDFSVMIHAGWAKMKIIWANLLSALATFVGALGVYFYAANGAVIEETFLAPIVAIAAGGFLYIAAADLIPELKHEIELKNTIIQIILMIAGAALVYYLGILLPE
jgi:zinc and cadmium transporter